MIFGGKEEEADISAKVCRFFGKIENDFGTIRIITGEHWMKIGRLRSLPSDIVPSEEIAKLCCTTGYEGEGQRAGRSEGFGCRGRFFLWIEP